MGGKRKTATRQDRSGALRRRAAILIARGTSAADVADVLGVTVRSIERWKAEPTFRAMLDREMERASDKLRGPLDESLDVLARGAAAAARRLVVIATTSEDESAAVRAAAIVLERAGLKSHMQMTLDLTGVDDETLFAELERARAEILSQQPMALPGQVIEHEDDDEQDDEAEEADDA